MQWFFFLSETVSHLLYCTHNRWRKLAESDLLNEIAWNCVAFVGCDQTSCHADFPRLSPTSSCRWSLIWLAPRFSHLYTPFIHFPHSAYAFETHRIDFRNRSRRHSNQQQLCYGQDDPFTTLRSISLFALFACQRPPFTT